MRVGKKTIALIAAAVVVLGIGAGVGVSLLAKQQAEQLADRETEEALADAGASLQLAQRQRETAASQLEDAREAALDEHARAAAVHDIIDEAMILDPSLKASLGTALQQLSGIAAADGEPVGAPTGTPSATGQQAAEPGSRSEQQAAARQILTEASKIETETTRLQRQRNDIDQAADDLRGALEELLGSAYSKGVELEIPEHASQESTDGFSAACAALQSPAPDSDLAALVQAYQLAWQAVVASGEEATAALNAATMPSGAASVGAADTGSPAGDAGGPTVIGGILIANKTYALPSWYGSGLTGETLNAFSAMQAEAASLGLNLYISSGFRSYWDQAAIYNQYVARDGQAAADRYSARPGHSEHQSGLALDVNWISESFAYTPEGEWVRDNAHRFGFVIRYPPGKEHVTGYMWEPWHLRYLGTDVATVLYSSGLSLEEYLGITSQYAY